ncbi:hypothetical protein [Delftia sp. PS-11]|uniref:hypothetical protein n=1 Tax=Delftia sp. PS-11 TaxID=2767222 RepID=UPI003AB3819F
MPFSSLKLTNQGWSKIVGPNSLEGRLASRACYEICAINCQAPVESGDAPQTLSY